MGTLLSVPCVWASSGSFLIPVTFPLYASSYFYPRQFYRFCFLAPRVHVSLEGKSISRCAHICFCILLFTRPHWADHWYSPYQEISCCCWTLFKACLPLDPIVSYFYAIYYCHLTCLSVCLSVCLSPHPLNRLHKIFFKELKVSRTNSKFQAVMLPKVALSWTQIYERLHTTPPTSTHLHIYFT